MKYRIILVLMMIEATVSAQSFDFDLKLQSYPYTYEAVTGKKTMMSSLIEMQQPDKPPYSKKKLLAQYGFGLAGGLAAGYAGAILAIYLSDEKDASWDVIGYALIGAYTGFAIARPYIIYWFGNYKDYTGSFWWTFLTYHATFVTTGAFTTSISDNDYSVLLADGIACVAASYMHYRTLKKNDNKISSIQISPTLLQAENRNFISGLKLSFKF